MVVAEAVRAGAVAVAMTTLGVGAGHQRRPVGGALAVAGALAAGVLVERVEGHALCIHHQLVLE